MSSYYQVAVNFPKINSELTYKSSEELLIGDLVNVPLGKRKSQGVVMGVSSPEQIDDVDNSKVKELEGKIEGSFSLDQSELEIYKWMSKYYHYSLGKLIFDSLPKILKRPKKPKFEDGDGKDLPFDLSPDQKEVYDAIESGLDSGFSQHYIHGVTGSGKSLVYLYLIKKVLESGRSAQFLLPEINLTPQFVKMFQAYLGHKVFSYHSGVTPSEKYNIWKALKESKEPVLVMGVRSSIFLPIQNLGLVVVDEEHDNSFKQNDRCPYNGRDVAIKKAQLSNATVVLGSATPTMENYHLFSKGAGGRHYYTLKNRVGEGHFPKLRLLDAKNQFKENDPAYPLMPETLAAIRKRLEMGEQVLIFINKLGYSHYVQCRSCGHQFMNEKCGCENNLRYFKRRNLLSCAHCEYKQPLPEKCPDCGSISLLNKGFGTEKVESVLKKQLSEYRTERFDRDEISTLKDLNDKLDRFHSKEIDIFVGTQMLAKGHNFEKVNLVVMLGVDSMLNFSDFRSTERMYQLAKQVAGRAGRYNPDSEVLVQTMTPEHNVFHFIRENSFDGFYKDELMLRQICFCPPYSKMTILYFSSRFRDRVVKTIGEVANNLQKVIATNFPEVRLMGPSPLTIEKKANQFTWAIMLKTENVNQLHNLLNTFEQNYKSISNVSYKIDVDPVQIF
ncbi:MAG: primosomal protein N' [Peredibacter sp.]|nr:primosomal protein N' [Peredibacter sp.]